MAEVPASPAPRHLLPALALAALLLGAAHLLSARAFSPAAEHAAPRPTPQAATPDNNRDEARNTELRIDRAAREAALAEADRQRREQNFQAALAAREQADAMAQLDQERKDQAWLRFYVKPAKCRNASDPSTTVECSNHYLREQQRFEKLWAEGKLGKA